MTIYHDRLETLVREQIAERKALRLAHLAETRKLAEEHEAQRNAIGAAFRKAEKAETLMAFMPMARCTECSVRPAALHAGHAFLCEACLSNA